MAFGRPTIRGSRKRLQKPQ